MPEQATAPKKSKKKPPESIADKIRRHLKALETGKKFYARADSILEEILRQIDPGEVVHLDDKGKTAAVVDKWAGKTKVVSIAFARRYEVEVHNA